MPPVINPNFKSTPDLMKPPLCQSCQSPCSKPYTPKLNESTKAQQDQEEVLSWDGDDISDFLSADQYIVNTPSYQVMTEKHIYGGTLLMLLLLVLSGPRNKSHLKLEILWWLRNTLNNGYLNRLLLNCIVGMESPMPNFLLKITRTSSRLIHFLELVITIKMPLLSVQFKPSCKWSGPFWLMFLCTGSNVVLKIFNCGVLLWNMLFGSTTAIPPISLV